jgi:hypothetical protein
MAFCENGRRCATTRRFAPRNLLQRKDCRASHQMKTAALIGAKALHVTCRTDVAGSSQPYTRQSDFGPFRQPRTIICVLRRDL